MDNSFPLILMQLILQYFVHLGHYIVGNYLLNVYLGIRRYTPYVGYAGV